VVVVFGTGESATETLRHFVVTDHWVVSRPDDSRSKKPQVTILATPPGVTFAPALPRS
jgi:hypothetical protein